MHEESHYIISFPRSGQHLIMRFLKFFSEKVGMEFSYCEYYSHCRKMPCSEGRRYQKNHDLNLDISIDNRSKYLVLFRSNMLEQLEAYYRYKVFESELRLNPSAKPSKERIINYEGKNKEDLFVFIKKQNKFYTGFLEKWVLNDHSFIMKLDYDELLADPSRLNRVTEFFLGTSSVNIVEDFQKKEPIKKRRFVNFNL